jgi:hypothetical protein
MMMMLGRSQRGDAGIRRFLADNVQGNTTQMSVSQILGKGMLI